MIISIDAEGKQGKIIDDLIVYAYVFAVYLDRELLKSTERCSHAS